jgi:hypothetical protein
MNAEIRRTKARLLDEVPKLQRLAVKKVEISSSFVVALIFMVCFVNFDIHC